MIIQNIFKFMINKNPIPLKNQFFFAQNKNTHQQLNYSDQLFKHMQKNGVNFNQKIETTLSNTVYKIKPTNVFHFSNQYKFSYSYFQNKIDDCENQNAIIYMLNNSIYAFKLQTFTSEQLYYQKISQTDLSSVKYCSGVPFIATGDYQGFFGIVDITKCHQLRYFNSHNGRIGRLIYKDSILLSGSQDGTIKQNDLRIKQAVVNTIQGNNGQICGLNIQNFFLVSSSFGGKIKIYDLRFQKNELVTIDHFLGHPVKCLTWCPQRANTFISGGRKSTYNFSQNSSIIRYDLNEQRLQEQILNKRKIYTDITTGNSQLYYAEWDQIQHGSFIKNSNLNQQKSEIFRTDLIRGNISAIKFNIVNGISTLTSFSDDQQIKIYDVSGRDLGNIIN